MKILFLRKTVYKHDRILSITINRIKIDYLTNLKNNGKTETFPFSSPLFYSWTTLILFIMCFQDEKLKLNYLPVDIILMQEKSLDVSITMSYLPERQTLCHMCCPENDRAAKEIMNAKKL